MSDTQLNELVINELTKAQYEALTPVSNQLYMVTDEVPLDSSDIVTSISSSSTDDKVPSAKAVYNYHDSTKQDTLVSGTNIKTINNTPLLGSGDITIETAPAIDNTTITKNSNQQLQASSLVGLTSTITELNYTDGVTSNIQTQLDNKQASGNYVTTDTDQTITNHKLISFDESDMGSQASLLGIISDQNSSATQSWIGRTLIGAKDLTFLIGTFNSMAGIGAHSWSDATTQSNAAWADFYLNPDGNKSVYIGGNNWAMNSGWLKVENSGSTSGGKVYYNKGTINNVDWKEVVVINDNSTSDTDVTWSANKLNTTIGNIESALLALRGNV